MEMRYLRSVCGVSRMNEMSHENNYEHFGICHVGGGKKCEFVEEVVTDFLFIYLFFIYLFIYLFIY